jgi:hypothetical protein
MLHWRDTLVIIVIISRRLIEKKENRLVNTWTGINSRPAGLYIPYYTLYCISILE